MEELYQVGAITQTHGIKGEVKVFPMTDDINRFKKMKGLILDTGKEYLTLEVTSVRPQKNLVILKFKEFDNINDVERFKGCGLYVTKDNRVKCEEDEYFIADLIGMQVEGDDGIIYGEVCDVISTGANDVYVVKGENEKEILFPAIKDCILQVDMQQGKILVHAMKGLLD